MIIDLAGEFRQKVFLAAMLECAMLLPVVSIKSAMKPSIRYGDYFGAVRQRQHAISYNAAPPAIALQWIYC